MSADASTGSPPSRGRPSKQFVIHDDAENNNSLKATRQGGTKAKIDHDCTIDDFEEDSYAALLAKLTEHQRAPPSPKEPIEIKSVITKGKAQEGKGEPSSSPIVMTPANENLSEGEKQVSEEDTVKMGKAEMLRLKKELNAAKQQLEMQKRELDQNRIINQTLEQAMGPVGSGEDAGANKANNGNKKPANITQQQHTSFSPSQLATSRPNFSNYSASFEPQSLPSYNIPHDIWSSASRQPLNLSPTRQQFQQPMTIWGQPATAARPVNMRAANQGMPPSAMPPQQPMTQHRILSGPSSPGTIGDGRFVNDFNQYHPGFGVRRNNMQDLRNDALDAQQRNNSNGWPVIGNGVGGLEAMNIGMNPNHAYQAMGMYQPTMPYQPRPIGTPLSPTASEFRTDEPPTGPWNTPVSHGSLACLSNKDPADRLDQAPSSPGQVYVQPMEPLNYRRLLDRTVSCNWKYIVDKIVCNNDQQASIFLQQKLKVGTVEQKYEIIEAIVAQAYPLMVNRFGNFLVQRCFEHGTPEQVVAIANAIRGNTLSLSMDAFGCHVVQKAFDAVPEEYKAIMVHELLRRIPETVIHRYACHVWQKLFELRWADSPPQIMKYVNEALRGMWHDVALGETGSLVVQNIFENCLEEDKRPCINEVLNNIDIVAHGQFGNWCIQHICEHGAPQDRSRAIDHVLRYATEYSMDQFASKVVEKCLKIGSSEFLERYLERVCEGRPDRPRIPLIDIASDQYGNYLVQYILTHANNTHREIVASNVRKHMVSLRGSKFGSRVGMLCCNPAYATHPGPGVGMSNTRFPSAPAQGPRFGGAYR
ncbi:MAG: hypothetical protein LQ343_006782 [Gyalolechia ehrenbergii]|nr:MAG: hypothetical protein LQ343_006782 [Gyalolechia ehrenbergii]